MLQISNIDKQTEDVVSYIVKKAGGTIINNSKELDLPNNYSKEQILSINKRWKAIEKSFLNEEKGNR